MSDSISEFDYLVPLLKLFICHSGFEMENFQLSFEAFMEKYYKNHIFPELRKLAAENLHVEDLYSFWECSENTLEIEMHRCEAFWKDNEALRNRHSIKVAEILINRQENIFLTKFMNFLISKPINYRLKLGKYYQMFFLNLMFIQHNNFERKHAFNK